MDNRIDAVMPPHHRSFHWGGYCIGFALGGFFDAILLQQVLQWHHFLSGVARAPFGDPHVQLLADGLFQAVMYAIAVIGIWLLARARHTWMLKAAGRVLAADVLIGFGSWHVLDAMLSYWIFGIHHVRMDAPDRWFWDVLWFLVFGVLFVAAGFFLRSRREPPPSGKDRRARTRSAIGPALMLAATAGALSTAPAEKESAGNLRDQAFFHQVARLRYSMYSAHGLTSARRA